MRCTRNIIAVLVMATLLCACSADTNPDQPDAQAVDAPTNTVQADGIEVTITASARKIEVGQPLHVDLEVLADSKFDIDLPDVPKVLGPFEVRSATRMPPIPVDGKRRTQLQFVLMTFDAGSVEVPPLEVSYHDTNDANAAPMTLATNPISIAVTTVVGDDAEPTSYRDIKEAADMPTEFAWTWWIVGAGVLVVCIIVVLLIVLMARRGKEERIAPPLPPHEWALRELESLERDGLIHQRAFEPFYVRLSAIVRGYLERRFGMMAPERTTDEFLREAGRSKSLTSEQRESLGSFLRAADMVKFARYEPAETDCEAALRSAHAFVKQTVPTAKADTPEQQIVGASA